MKPIYCFSAVVLSISVLILGNSAADAQRLSELKSQVRCVTGHGPIKGLVVDIGNRSVPAADLIDSLRAKLGKIPKFTQKVRRRSLKSSLAFLLSSTDRCDSGGTLLPRLLGPCDDGIDNDGDGAIDMEDHDEGGVDCYTAGAITYVSSSIGSDSYDGTAPSVSGSHGPKATLNAALTALFAQGQLGRKVLLRAGDTWNTSGNMTFDYRASGTEALPVTFGRYGAGDPPTINQTQLGNTTLSIRGGSETQRMQYLVIDGVRFTNSNPDSSDRGTAVFIAEGYPPYLAPGLPWHITFQNTYFEHVRIGLINYGLFVTVQNSHFNDNIYNNGSGNNTDDCIFTDGDDFAALGNTFHKCGNDWNWYGHALYAGGDNVRIEDNLFDGVNTGPKLCGSNGSIVRNNTFRSVLQSALSFGSGTNGPVTNLLVEANLFEDSVTDAITLKKQHADDLAWGGIHFVQIINNIFRHGTGGGYSGVVHIDPDLSMSDILIANNLFRDTGEDADFVLNYAGIQNLALVNNIFFKAGNSSGYPSVRIESLADQSQLSMRHNLYWHPGGSLINYFGTDFTNLAAFQSAHTEKEIGSIQADPLFRTRIMTDQPQLRSPALSSGELLPDVGIDILSNPRPLGAGPDIGPFER